VDPEITNTLEPRTNWAICMGPMGNLQGSYKFLSFATRKKVTCRKFTEMPVTEAVIKQVEEMAVKDGAVKGISFIDRKGVEYEFDNDEEYRMLVVLEEEVPNDLKVLLTLSSTWTSLSKHTTEDPTPGCLSRRRIAKMIYFKL
jgi:hypothetical protein